VSRCRSKAEARAMLETLLGSDMTFTDKAEAKKLALNS
jgi:hypothetical protein